MLGKISPIDGFLLGAALVALLEFIALFIEDYRAYSAPVGVAVWTLIECGAALTIRIVRRMKAGV